MQIFLLVHVLLGAGFLIGQPGTARADFQINPGQVRGQAPEPPPAEDTLPLAPEAGFPVRRPPPAPRFRVARGFGRSVSLGFAARQIVPPAVTVRFGAGVDPASTVDWSGGQFWNRVLAAAVQPLGLRVVTGTSSVLILR